MIEALRHRRPNDASARSRARRQGLPAPAPGSGPRARTLARLADRRAYAEAGARLARASIYARAREAAAYALARVVAPAALGALLAFAPAVAGPLAGTPIDNTATGSGFDVARAVTLRPASNPVRAVVQPLEALRLTAGPAWTARPGDAVVFPHTLHNDGNTPSDYRLDLANAGGDDFDLAALAIVRDLDRDGAVSAADAPVPPGGTVSLAAGDSAALLVTGTVPLAAPGVARAWVSLTATSQAQGATASVTDTVATPALGPPPSVAFYTASDFTRTTRRTSLGAPLYVQATAPQADLRPAQIDTITIRLTTRLTADLDDFLALETGPHTGTFRIVPYVTAVTPPPGGTALAGDGVVSSRRGEEISATVFGWGAPRTDANVWVDPAGEVFDAGSGAALGGARVQLIDVTGAGNGGRPGQLAQVYATDGVTPASADVTSDAVGLFEFPWVAPSTYRLLVLPPATYRFPSLAAPASLAPGHVLDQAGSFGQPFPVTEVGAPVVVDLPVDALHPIVLFAEKAASRPEAEIGDDVGYQVRVANRSDSTVTTLVVRDGLPSGFAYVGGSARVDGVAVADPARAGGRLTFTLGALASRATVTLAYRAHIGPGASLGDALNRAVADGGSTRSNEAVARVTVRGGVFADEGTILGTVGIDLDRDGRLSAGEPGLAGVRMVLDDGTWAVTDARGRYSFTGVAPRTHALKIDPATVPAAATLIALDHRTGDQPGLRFVDLTRGELVRADFAALGDTATLREASDRGVAARRGETDRLLARGTDPLHPQQPTTDPHALPASRVLTGENGLPLARRAASGASEAGAGSSPAPEAGSPAALEAAGALASADEGGGLPSDAGAAAAAGTMTGATTDGAGASPPPGGAADGAAAAPIAALSSSVLATAPLEQLVPRLDAEPGFLGLADLDTVAVTQIAVRVKGGAGSQLELYVNGELEPASRVAQRVIAPESGTEALEFLGVDLRPGINLLEVAPARSLARAAVRVVAPGPLEALLLSAPRDVPADGFTPAELTLALLDAHGVAVGARTLVTIESSLGRVRLDDLDPDAAGIQIAVEGGRARVPIEAPPAPGVARVTAQTGELRAAAYVPFTSELRRVLAVGVLEGVLGWNGFSKRAGAADLREARFEAPVEQFAAASRDGRATAAARGALYMQGRVSGPWSLTLGYDSDRERDARRFRDLQPDAGYAVLGDASVRGYDAQSTGRLFTRIERPGAWLMYGDYVTSGIGSPTDGGSRALAAYNRSFSGAQTHWEEGALRVDAFTSRDRTRSRTDELPGLGISGPYQLGTFPLVENTERVEVIVRDRDHPSVVLSSEARERFTDYEVEPFTGRLLFRAPVPSLDAALNPVFVRVTYEVRTSDGGPAGDPFWVHGGTARWKATPALELSGTAVDDHDPTAPRELRGASFRAQLAPHTLLEGEWALTQRLGQDAGQGGRLDLRHAVGGVDAHVWGASTGTRFDNPSAGFAGGRDEAGAQLVARLAERTRMTAEASYSGDAAGSDRRGGGLLALERALNDAWRGQLGVRVSDGSARAGGEDPLVAAVRTRLGWQPPAHPEWTSYAEAEQDVREADRRMAALGSEYRVAQRGRLYARHELISSLGGNFDLNGAQQRLATVVGLDADVRRDQHVFGEYRLADVLAGREAQAAVGLRNGWQVAPDTRLGTSFERVSPLGEGHPTTGATTAAALSVDFTGEGGWKGSSRIEVRANRSDTQLLQTLGTAVELDSAWTGLFRYALSVTEAHAADAAGEARARLQVGLAWRPGGAWEGLARWEGRYDRGAAALSPTALDAGDPDPRGRRVAGIVSINADGQVSEHDVMSVAWAGKLTREESFVATTSGGGQWARARATRDLARGWDVGWSASVLTGSRWDQRRWGLGAELGKQLPMGVWLTLGFNQFGYRDDELTDQEWTREGGYLRLRMKLDESTLRRAGGRR